MRHETGASLKGIPQSRGARIGVIYISPDDDRRAVLTAILAEEKLKREQIVLVLPQKNKAFQQPADFDDLKMLRRKLQGELVFVTPAGPGPAEFARQRRFAVFSTPESFAHSLTTGSTSQSDQSKPATSQPDNKPGKRGFFGGARKVAPIAAAGAAGIVAGEAAGRAGTARNTPSQRRHPGPRPASNVANQPTGPGAQRPPTPIRPTPLPPQTPRPPFEDEDEIIEADTVELHDDAKQTGTHDAESANATAPGGGQPAADDVRHTSSTGQGTGHQPNIDSDDALPPLPGQSVPSQSPKTPAATDTDATSKKTPGTSSRTPTPIVLGGAPVGIVEPAEPPSTPVTQPPTTPNRNTGKVVAAGALGAAAGAAAGEALTSTATGKTPAAPTRPTTNTGKTPAAPARNGGAANTLRPAGSISATSVGWPPPSPGRLRSSRGTQPPNRKWLAILIVAALVILTLLVLGGLTVSANPGMLSFIAPPPATITITPTSKTVQDTYIMQGVTSNANPDNRQVSVRQLTATKTATDTVTATGVGHIAAAPAAGTLTFQNGGASYDLLAGTVFNGPNGVAVSNDRFVTIPAVNFNTGTLGQITVNAHAANPGRAGDAPGGAINTTCCRGDGSVRVISGPFSGGQDALDYKFLQQSDVDKVTTVHQDTLKGNAQNDVNSQIKMGEKLLGDISCQTSTDTAGKPVGDKAENITSANVTVGVTCNAQVYDATAIQTIAEKALKQKVSKDPTLAGYVLAGHIITQAQPQDGPITFSVTAKGVWYYNWTEANQKTLLNKIKGKTKAQAQTILNSDPGIDQANKAKIDIGNNGTTLPTDANQIKLVVNTVNGL